MGRGGRVAMLGYVEYRRDITESSKSKKPQQSYSLTYYICWGDLAG